jgi:hypothetical protein
MGTIQYGKDIGYYISQEEKCLELAATNTKILNEIISMCLIRGIQIFKIGSNHPAFNYLISAGGIYSTRPEFPRGHMMKSYRNGECLSEYLAEVKSKFREKINSEEKYSMRHQFSQRVVKMNNSKLSSIKQTKESYKIELKKQYPEYLAKLIVDRKFAKVTIISAFQNSKKLKILEYKRLIL